MSNTIGTPFKEGARRVLLCGSGELGKEVALGQGKVNFPVLIPKLKSMGYRNPVTIEREISGDQQIADIKIAIELLKTLV